MSNEPSMPALTGNTKKVFDAFWDHDARRPRMDADGQPAPVLIDTLYLLITSGEDWEENRRKRQQVVGATISHLNRRIQPLGLRIRPSATWKHAYVIGRI